MTEERDRWVAAVVEGEEEKRIREARRRDS